MVSDLLHFLCLLDHFPVHLHNKEILLLNKKVHFLYTYVQSHFQTVPPLYLSEDFFFPFLLLHLQTAKTRINMKMLQLTINNAVNTPNATIQVLSVGARADIIKS